MGAFFQVAAAALLCIVSAIVPPLNTQLLPKVAQSSNDCRFSSTSYYKWENITENLYIKYQQCKCGSQTSDMWITARYGAIKCVSNYMRRNDGKQCNPNKILWETYDNYCTQCNGKITTATISQKDQSGKFTYFTVDRVCNLLPFISPTPTPRPCVYRTRIFNRTDETVSLFAHKCDCGIRDETIYRRFTYPLQKCAKNCISRMDGNFCNTLRMPSSSYYDRCCTICGGDHWLVDVLRKPSDGRRVTRVCTKKLARTPSPSPKPKALNCRYNIAIEESVYLTTEKIKYECLCDRHFTDQFGYMQIYSLLSDPSTVDCYHKCLFKRQGVKCNPYEFYSYYAEDCCTKCSGTYFRQNLRHQISGEVTSKSVCRPISKVLAIPTPSPSGVAKPCEYKIRFLRLDSDNFSIIAHDCDCGNQRESEIKLYGHSLDTCAKNCISRLNGNSCSLLRMQPHSFYDGCCASCGGELWSRDVFLGASFGTVSNTQVCLVPLTASPTPSASPNALICKYNSTIEESTYLSTKKIRYECQCNRYSGVWSWFSMYADSAITNCYHNCLLKRQGMRCDPSKLNINTAKDCCTKCDGTQFEQKLIYRSNGREERKDICTPRWKARKALSSSQGTCSLETTVSTDFMSLPLIYSTCDCETVSRYRAFGAEKSIALCLRNYVAENDGSLCDTTARRIFDLIDSCTKCGGRSEMRNLTYQFPNFGKFELPVCKDLSPSPNYRPVRDSYNLAFENDPEENLNISRHLIDATLSTELPEGTSLFVTVELYFDDEEDDDTTNGNASAADMTVSRIGQDASETTRQTKQKRKSCKGKNNCGFIASVKPFKPKKGKTQKEALNKAINQLDKKGKNKNVLNQKKKPKPTFNKEKNVWQAKRTFSKNYADVW